MILVDTSIWIDHLRKGDARLVQALEDGRVLGHAFVTGELACGHLSQRELVIELLASLPQATMAEHTEVLGFIGTHRLHGRGIGYVDAHLLTATALTPGARLWSRDRRLSELAGALGMAAAP